jgi:broad specificity phosphatase PhoE
VYRAPAQVIVGIRHAQVWNPEGLVYARLPGFHLSDEGRTAAKALAEALSSTPLRAVYSGPLDRAMETAAILSAPHGLRVLGDERLTEWSFWARWQGMPWTRIRERDPHLLEAYGLEPAKACPEDPLEEAGRRVLAWARDAERAHPEGLVAGLTHEAPLLAAYLVGGGHDVSTYRSMNLPHLGGVRLRPGPPELVDLVQWARTC